MQPLKSVIPCLLKRVFTTGARVELKSGATAPVVKSVQITRSIKTHYSIKATL